MSVFIQIQEQLKIYDNINKLANKINYQNKKKFFEFISLIKNSQNLLDFLNKGFFDYKYSSKELLLKLAMSMDLNETKLKNEIREEEKIRDEIKKFNNCFIHMITNFKRNGETIFSLIGLQRKLIIKVNVMDLLFKNEENILKIVSDTVKKSYKEIKEVEVFGKVEGYRFFCLNKIYYFNTNGELLKIENIKKD
jgi:hypothetical protein